MNKRIIHLEGGYNFRDVGGYATNTGQNVRMGRIYRAGSLHLLSDSDLQILDDLKIRAVFDLREEEEYQREGQDRLSDSMRYFPFPTTLGRDAMIQQLQSDAANFRMATYYVSSFLPRAAYHGGIFKSILENLAEDNVVFHCSAGKDRTGILAALMQRLLGVSDADIVADYLLTRELLTQYAQRQRQNYEKYGIPSETIDDLLGVKPENITEMLAHLEANFPTTADYFRAGGVTEAELEQFKTLMID